MKNLVLVSALILGFGGIFSYARFANKNSSQETVTVKSATVSGNITDQLLTVPNQPLVSTKNVIKATLNEQRVLFLNTEVTYKTAQALSNQIKQLQRTSSEPIWLLIDSPGGSVLDGALVISEMESSKAPVNTVCVGLCASMAAMIHSYGAKRYAVDRSVLMYHPASGGAQGQIPNMLSQLTTISRYIDKMVSNIVSRSKISKAEYEKLVAYEFWIDAEDAYAKGLTDGTVNVNLPSAQNTVPAQEEQPPLPEEQKNRPSYKRLDVQMISPYPHLWKTHAGKN